MHPKNTGKCLSSWFLHLWLLLEGFIPVPNCTDPLLRISENSIWIAPKWALKHRHITVFSFLLGNLVPISHKTFHTQIFMQNISNTFCRCHYGVRYLPQFYFAVIQNNMMFIYRIFWSWYPNWTSRRLSIICAGTAAYKFIEAVTNSLYSMKQIRHKASQVIHELGMYFVFYKKQYLINTQIPFRQLLSQRQR